MKLFRFGVDVGRATSWAEWAAKARKLENLGYSVLTVPDHLTDFLAPLPVAAGIRVARLAEAVIIIKGLFTGAPVTFAGQHYHVTGHQLHPLPVQHPHLPLLTGATAGDSSRSPRRKLILSASRVSPYDAVARRRILTGGSSQASRNGCSSSARRPGTATTASN